MGKTTACGKLALFLQKRKKKVMMVATDVYRPAAIDQLVKLGTKIDVPVFEMGTDVSPVEIARRGIEKAIAEGVDAVIVDTAGRLQVGGFGWSWVLDWGRPCRQLNNSTTRV